MSAELDIVMAEMKALEHKLAELEREKKTLYQRERNANFIESDDPVLREEVEPDEVNYVLGQSKGYVDGFQSAVNTIISVLADEYREIPIGEAELFMIYELGTIKERSWLKDHKQQSIMEKLGWKMDYKNMTPVWRKEVKANEEDEA